MVPSRTTTMVTIVWAAIWLAATGLCRAADHPSVIIHFAKGKSHLDTEDKTKIRELFSNYIMDAQSRVFIVGYTDSSGNEKQNFKLSRQRAQSVRREIVSAFGVDATIVMAMGKGEASPVANNRSAKGQALNRRAEIFLANARERMPKRQYGPDDPYLPEIQNFVQQADTQMRHGQLNQAIATLRRAHAIGGDHYSDWNATYGIAGYYANAPLETIRAHLDKALVLDPHNFQAREYLSRVDARQKVALGQVGPDMGQAVESPIEVSSLAQEDEYLRLFEVEPLRRLTLDAKSIDRWECLTTDGVPVVYYFDLTGMYRWGFGGTEKASSAMVPRMPSRTATTAAVLNESGPPSHSSRRQLQDNSDKAKAKTIWESAVFR